MKEFVWYSNCQNQVDFFLKKTALAQEYNFTRINNWQLIMHEQDHEWAYEQLRRADILCYQPTTVMRCVDGTDVSDCWTLFDAYCKPSCIKVSFSYNYNMGFFPILKVHESAMGFVTGKALHGALWGDPNSPLLDNPKLNFYDCARRMLECLAEQSRREVEYKVDAPMADFILRNYRTKRLFLNQNHPASALYVGLAKRLLQAIKAKATGTFWESFEVPDIEYQGDNDVGMNGVLPVHESVCRELGLEYAPDSDERQYLTWFKELSMFPRT